MDCYLANDCSMGAGGGGKRPVVRSNEPKALLPTLPLSRLFPPLSGGGGAGGEGRRPFFPFLGGGGRGVASSFLMPIISIIFAAVGEKSLSEKKSFSTPIASWVRSLEIKAEVRGVLSVLPLSWVIKVCLRASFVGVVVRSGPSPTREEGPAFTSAPPSTPPSSVPVRSISRGLVVAAVGLVVGGGKGGAV